MVASYITTVCIDIKHEIGTTIPAGTAVMTGTPMGVGVFQNPKAFLQDGDVVEIGIPNVAVLRNRIKFE